MDTRSGITDEEVFDAMEREGGGFVSHLGAAWRRADLINYRKLMNVFGDYYLEYFERATEARQRAT